MTDDNSHIKHQPNPSWYKPIKRLSFWHEDSNRKLALFGAKSHLCCGGVWFLLASCTNEKLAVCIEYAADSYNHMAEVYLFDDTCPKWYELQRHLSLYQHTIFVTKPKSDFLADIGISDPVCQGFKRIHPMTWIETHDLLEHKRTYLLEGCNDRN